MSSTKNTAVYSFAHFLDVKLAELLEHIECWRDCFRREQELTQLLIVAENSLKDNSKNFRYSSLISNETLTDSLRRKTSFNLSHVH
jgi:hypothetical protein